jgi:hypothetical protein
MILLHVRSVPSGIGRRLPRIALLVGVLTSALAIGGGSAGASAASTVRHLYGVAPVGNARELVPFDVSSTGQLSERADQAVPVPASVLSVVVSRDARTVYVGSQGGWDDDDNQIPGTIKVFAVAGDGSLSLQQTVIAPPRQMVLSPDGSRLFEWDDYGLVVSFAIADDGSLGPAIPNPSVVGSARALAVTPDGSTLYVAVYPQQLEQYAIGVDGSLTAQLPEEVGLYGCRADFLGVTPDGSQLDALCYNQGITLSLASGDGLAFNGSLFGTWGGSPNVEDVRGRALYKAIYPNALEHMQRQSDGTLADFPTPLIFDAARVSGIAADPGGTMLAVANAANTLESYAIAANGSLSSAPVAAISTALNSYSLLAFAPDQPPIAVLGSSRAGSTVHLDASASVAVNGVVARYDWDFGDGTALADGGPTPTHTYAAPGDYVATVTLTDSAGCSTAETFTGAMSICAGSAAAATSETVHVTSNPAPPPVSPPVPPPSPPTDPTPPASAPSPPSVPEPLVVPRSLTGTAGVGGSRVRLTWTPAPGAPPVSRYLIAWSSLHSAQGPTDPHMRHVWTSQTHLLMPGARPGTTLHYAIYAVGSDGRLTKAGKTTIRLPR